MTPSINKDGNERERTRRERERERERERANTWEEEYLDGCPQQIAVPPPPSGFILLSLPLPLCNSLHSSSHFELAEEMRQHSLSKYSYRRRGNTRHIHFPCRLFSIAFHPIFFPVLNKGLFRDWKGRKRDGEDVWGGEINTLTLVCGKAGRSHW
jgi:hypothetical protein